MREPEPAEAAGGMVEVRPADRDQPHRDQRVREIEPADIVGNRIAGGALKSHVEM